MTRSHTLPDALARALRHPDRWPSLLASVVRVARRKGLRGVREGIGFWEAKTREPDLPAPPAAAPPVSSARWFEETGGPYQAWARERSPERAGEDALRAARRLLPSLPRFAVLVLPALDGDEGADAARSIAAAQVYEADRVTVRAFDGHGVAEAVNRFAEGQTSEWLAFLRAGDALEGDALAQAALALADDPDADLLFSDEDCVTPDGTRFAPLFKPGFSPDLLDALPYASRFLVVRRDAFLALGGLRAGYDGAEEYDLSLRASEAGRWFRRLPLPLYHRRVADTSGATAGLLHSDAALRMHRAARRALEDSLARRGAAGAQVRDGERAGEFRVVYPLPDPRPLVSVIVPFRDRPDLLRACAESVLTRTEYAPYELVLLDNGSREAETEALLARFATFPQVRVIRHDAPFNFSAINNEAARHARGDYLLLLNNDTRVIAPDWIGEMLRHAARPGVGAVGATLLFPDDTIQHAGVALGVTGLAGHVWAGLREDEVPGGWSRHARDVSAVTAACLMTPRAAWEALGGLDERFVVCGNDVDYCLRARRAGLRVLHVPTARLYHDETQSRDAASVLPQDLDMSALSYGPHLGKTDPFYNPNLTAASTRATLRRPGEPTEPDPPRPVGPFPPPAHPRHPDWNRREGAAE